MRTYDKVLALYRRTTNGIDNFKIQGQRGVSLTATEVLAQIMGATKEECFGLMRIPYGENVIFDLKNQNDVFVGLVTANENISTFDTWCIKTILENGLFLLSEGLNLSDVEEYSAAITELFANTLKNCAADDLWESVGLEVFETNVRFFVARGLQIETVLPAFPCKSSNRKKAKSSLPDKGEELALLTIINFVQAVNSLYPPGLLFHIISDGHVFSDCINVNDNEVDEYAKGLQELYHSIKPKDFTNIHFRGLGECFESEDKQEISEFVHQFKLDHHLNTKLENEAEINRKILMLACDNDHGKLKLEIKSQIHPRLSLHRGFMTFMREDLRGVQAEKSLSNKSYKNLTSRIAFEMIRRNEAYSNLLELMFPFHIRLSIHAHKNNGPKFGIKLLNNCKLLGLDISNSDQLLHIPTPWHNAIFQVGDERTIYVSAVKNTEYFVKSYTGGWCDVQKCYIFTNFEITTLDEKDSVVRLIEL